MQPKVIEKPGMFYQIISNMAGIFLPRVQRMDWVQSRNEKVAGNKVME